MEMYGTKRKSSAGYVIGIVICLILFIFALILGILGLLSAEDGETPNIFGYSVYTADVSAGDVADHYAVLVDRRVAEFKSGQPIVYRNAGAAFDAMSFGYFVSADQDMYTVSMGDAEEQAVVHAQNVRGLAIGFIPVLGVALSVAQSTYGGMLFILLAFFLLLLVIMFSFKSSERKKKSPYVFDDAEKEPEYNEDKLVFTNDIVSDEEVPNADEEAPAEEETPVAEEERAELVAAANGSADEDHVTLVLNASEDEIDKLHGVIENGLIQKAHGPWEVRRTEAAEPTLTVRCMWQDMAVVAIIIHAIRNK